MNETNQNGTSHAGIEQQSSRFAEVEQIFLRTEEACQNIAVTADPESDTHKALLGQVGGWSVPYVNEYLHQIGVGVVEALQAWVGRNLNAYFWPGYEQLSGKGGRLMIEQASLDGQAVKLRHRGVGRFHDVNWEVDTNALWFNVVLDPSTPDLMPDDFEHGSTHTWLTEGHFKTHPDLLAVEVSDHPGPCERIPDFGRYGIRISLDRSSSKSWAADIRTAISEIIMPHGRRGEEDRQWPLASPPSPGDELRLAQYDAWLQACFIPDRTRAEKFLDPIAKVVRSLPREFPGGKSESYLAALRGVQEAVSDGRLAVQNDSASYDSWYAFRLFEPVGDFARDAANAPQGELSRQPTTLGTAMILISGHLDVAALRALSSWIRVMYMQLRQIERQVETERLVALRRSQAKEPLFASRVWTPKTDAYFSDEAGEVFHTFSRMRVADLIDCRTAFEATLTEILQRRPMFDVGCAAVHSALKGMLGYHAKARKGAAEEGLIDALTVRGEETTSYGLNFGSLALLLGAATAPNNSWFDTLVWPKGSIAFQECGFDQTPRQEYNLALALAGEAKPKGFFRNLAFREVAAVAQAAPDNQKEEGIRRAELGVGFLRIWLSWGMYESTKAERPSLLDRWRYSAVDDKPGSFVTSLTRLIDAFTRTDFGLRQRTLVRVEQSEGGALIEFRAVGAEFWRNGQQR